MQELKTFIQGGLNYDTEPHLVPPQDWVDAVNFCVGQSDEAKEGVGSNLDGNVKIGEYDMPAGDNICIGACPLESRNVVYAMICNSNKLHEILEINPQNNTIIPVFRNLTWTNNIDVLQWQPQNKIHSIDIIKRDDSEGDLLFWTDSATYPRKINIKKAKAFNTPNGYPSPILTEWTYLIKQPPKSPLTSWQNDLDRSVNNMRGKLFQFQIRFVYDDYEKSVWSNWADFSIPVQPFLPDRDSDPAVNNYIQLIIETGSPLVKKIEIGVRQNFQSDSANIWGDLSLIESLNKEELSIGDNTLYTYKFYNDWAGTPILPSETDQVWDFIPTKAGCQALVSGNTLCFGDITEGLSFDGALDVAMTSVESQQMTINNGDNFSVYNFSAKYKFGLIYLDQNNKSDGVHNYQSPNPNRSFEVNTVPYLGDSLTNNNYNLFIPKINAAIFHQPPVWAKKYKWVRTKCLNKGRSLYYVMRPTDTADANNLYFQFDPVIESINLWGQNALAYDFVPGDRITIVRRMSGNYSNSTSFGSPANFNIDLEILSMLKDPVIVQTQFTGSYLKVRKSTAAMQPIIITAPHLCEIYTPTNISNNEVYYDFGPEYSILNPGTNTRYHQGQLQDQGPGAAALFDFVTNGDTYYRKREYMQLRSDKNNNEILFFLNIPIVDFNFSDKFQSAVNGNSRPWIIDNNAKEQRLPSNIRYGGAYVQDTFINKTNNFPAANLIDSINRTNGAIRRMTVRDLQLRVFQEYKCSWVPINQNVLQTANGDPVVAQSNLLLNDPQPYEGDFGIGNAPCSLATKNFADYFHDTNRGVILRLSRDGLTPISIVSKINSWSIVEEPKYRSQQYNGIIPYFISNTPGNAQIYGVFETNTNRYYSFYEQIDSYDSEGNKTNVNTAKAIIWDEVRNRFISRMSLISPEWVTSLNNTMISFRNGGAWIHNDKVNRCKFYGFQQEWGIDLIFNDKFVVKKTFISTDVNGNLPIPIQGIITSLGQFSNLIEEDFKLLEGHYHASFLRDSLSPGGLLNGDSLKGSYILLPLLLSNGGGNIILKSVSVKSIVSQENNQ